MCGRFAQAIPLKVIAQRFSADEVLCSESPSFNIPPGRLVYVLKQSIKRQVVNMRWGISTRAASSLSPVNLINSRAETVTSRPYYRKLLLTSRCIIPADGFYEWTKTTAGKQPVFVKSLDGQPLAMAGIYSSSESDESGSEYSFSIITAEAPDWFREIHSRIPVTISLISAEKWLSPDSGGDSVIDMLTVPAEKNLEYYAVSSLVNSAANDGQELTLPAKVNGLFK